MVTVRRQSRLALSVQQELVKYFVAGVTARAASEMAGVNRMTAQLYFHKLREVIHERLSSETPQDMLDGEIEVDESYFGGARKGKRGRGAAGKIPVFGLLKRGGKVHAVIIPDAKTQTLLPEIRARVKPDSIIYSDSFRAYNALDVSEFHHRRINHSEVFAEKENHINGIENFWSQAKRHLRRFNGVPKKHFHLYLKECEWRFNYGPPSHLLKTLKYWLNLP